MVKGIEEVIGHQTDWVYARARTEDFSRSEGDGGVVHRVEDASLQGAVVEVFLRITKSRITNNIARI